MPKRRESDLYVPVRSFLENQGFVVRAEVKDCDCVAVRGEDVVIVELKPSFNLSLVFQGIDRQAVAEHVYLAVEPPKGRDSRSRRNDICRLCGRLGLGLLFVRFTAGGQAKVEVLRECTAADPRRNKRRQAQLLREFDKRSGDYNLGGAARRDGHKGRPVVTAYREEALQIAQYLQANGAARVHEIRAVTQNAKVNSILSKNYYGWFERVQRGVYVLTEPGQVALSTYSDVVRNLENSATG